MQISIKTNTGETVIIDWKQSDSLESIAGKIQEKTGISPSEQCWNLEVTKAKFQVKGILPTQQEMQSFYNSQDREIDIDFLDNIDLSKQLAERKAKIQGDENDWKLVKKDRKQLSSQSGVSGQHERKPGSKQRFERILFEITGSSFPSEKVMLATKIQVVKEYPGVRIDFWERKNRNKNQNGWWVEFKGCTPLLVPKERFMQLVNKKK